MKISDFFNQSFFRLPKNQTSKQDFKIFVSKILKEYLKELNSVDNFNDVDHHIEKIKLRQRHLVGCINSAIEDYYNGKPASALEKIRIGLNSSSKDFNQVLNIRTFETGNNFYRIRYHKENFSLKTEELFHIPFQLRGKVKTQRFSIPGFPSLYLGTSLYVCWEELNRPDLNDFQAIRLSNNEELKIVDLSPPQGESISSKDYYNFLMLWPLIFTSSIKVRYNEDTFKPEYIIPQLLLQWVRENSKIDGIAYQTTHIDFSETLVDGEFLNIVLPVQENKSRGLCKVLSNKFSSTEATSIPLHESATGNSPVLSFRQIDEELKIKQIELVKGKPSNYKISTFGKLENVLFDMEIKNIQSTT